MEIKKENIFFGLLVAGAVYYVSTSDAKKTNAQHLQSLSTSARNKFQPFITELKLKGFEPTIYSSKRGYLKQMKLYSKDKRRAKPGTSKHESGGAIDVSVKYKGQYLNSKTPLATWLNSGVPQIAQKYGLKWGGNFKGYFDANHFQIA